MIKQWIEMWIVYKETKRAEQNRCKSCEFAQYQLEIANRRIDELLERLNPVNTGESTRAHEDFQPIRPRFVPWAIKQQQLERESRERARPKVSVEDLEKELEIEHEEKSNG